MTYKNKKLNIEIENPYEEINIKENHNRIEIYKDSEKLLEVYNNSRITITKNYKFLTFDNSTVNSYGKSELYAYDNSSIYAYDNSVINANNSSNVYAYDNSSIEAQYNSEIRAHDNSKLNAYDQAIVFAYDNSIVSAFNTSIIHAYGNSTINASNFSTLYINCACAQSHRINHFGKIIISEFKVKKTMKVYKKLADDLIATLELSKGQVFQSECHYKCRTDRALVVAIESIDKSKSYDKGMSDHDKNFIYEVGKEVVADYYDTKINECSHGIHFFLTRKEAEEY